MVPELPIAPPFWVFKFFFKQQQGFLALPIFWATHTIIATSQGIQTLFIPINKNSSAKNWQPAHDLWIDYWLKTLKAAYGKAPFFEFFHAEFRDTLIRNKRGYLNEINSAVFNIYCNWLGLSCPDRPIKWIRKASEQKNDIAYQLPTYYQINPVPNEMQKNLGIIDVLMNVGKDARLWLFD